MMTAPETISRSYICRRKVEEVAGLTQVAKLSSFSRQSCSFSLASCSGVRGRWDARVGVRVGAQQSLAPSEENGIIKNDYLDSRKVEFTSPSSWHPESPTTKSNSARRDFNTCRTPFSPS